MLFFNVGNRYVKAISFITATPPVDAADSEASGEFNNEENYPIEIHVSNRPKNDRTKFTKAHFLLC